MYSSSIWQHGLPINSMPVRLARSELGATSSSSLMQCLQMLCQDQSCMHWTLLQLQLVRYFDSRSGPSAIMVMFCKHSISI